MKKLVVFYSLSGNTRAVARRIARSLRADLMEIRTVKTYPDDYDVLLSLGEKEVKAGYMPHAAITMLPGREGESKGTEISGMQTQAGCRHQAPEPVRLEKCRPGCT